VIVDTPHLLDDHDARYRTVCRARANEISSDRAGGTVVADPLPHQFHIVVS
jgi:hypothetical protein